MKKVLSDNIMNLEDYLLTASERHTFSSLMALEVSELWMIYNELNKHLKELPSQDEKSRAILAQMKIDEAHHADTAVHLGAAELPKPIKSAMQQMSKVMTATTYHL
ncbi:MAG: hypothetical protein EBU69_05420 [Methylophilaceae bacterium]|nr:hypothetical protein [Methylophilaceae bacterium]